MTNNDNDPMTILHALTTHNDSCPTRDGLPTEYDAHDAASEDLRELLIGNPFDGIDALDDPQSHAAVIDVMIDALNALCNDEYRRDDVSRLALDYSLCPIHFCDYAICFDDDDAECAQIRAVFPSHDS